MFSSRYRHLVAQLRQFKRKAQTTNVCPEKAQKIGTVIMCKCQFDK